MPRNDYGRPIIHQATKQMIGPGEWYPGRPVGTDGAYLPEKQPVTEAPKQGASTPVKLDPNDWPPRAELEKLRADELKDWAKAQELEFAGNIGKERLLDLVDQHRPKQPVNAGAPENTGTGGNTSTTENQ